MKNIHEMFNQWRKFLFDDKFLLEISEETISRDYQSAKEYIKKHVKSDFTNEMGFIFLQKAVSGINKDQ